MDETQNGMQQGNSGSSSQQGSTGQQSSQRQGMSGDDTQLNDDGSNIPEKMKRSAQDFDNQLEQEDDAA